MLLVGKTGILKDGRKFNVVDYQEGIVVNNDDVFEINDWITLNINSKNEKRALYKALNSGNLIFDDPKITEEIKEFYDELITAEKNSIKEVEDTYIERNANRVIEHNTGTPRRVIDRPGLSNNFIKYMDKTKVYKYSDVEVMHDIQIRYNGNGIKVNKNEIVLLSYLQKENGKLMHGDDFTSDGYFIYCGQNEQTNPRAKNNNDELANSNTTNKTLHLYISAASNEYYYQGKFKVISEINDPSGKRMFKLAKL